MLFCCHFFRPLNTFMRKEKDLEPDPDPDPCFRILEAIKHANPADPDPVPDPDPQHCFQNCELWKP
jgi:hypothetical protein